MKLNLFSPGRVGHRTQNHLDGVDDGLVENVQPQSEFVLGRGQRWRDPEDAAHARQLHDVHVQAEFQTAPSDPRAEHIGAAGLRGQFQADQQTPAPDVADDRSPGGDLVEASAQVCAQFGGVRRRGPR